MKSSQINYPEISVIIAAYNAEQYIERCLNSLLAQSFRNFEVIVVDDGSTDRTGLIVDRFQQKESSFIILHQDNLGVAAARQAGINAARGVYTIFVDSDDWVDPNMLDYLWSHAQITKADIVICDYYEVYKDHIDYNSQKPSPEDRTSIWGQSMNSLAGSLCNKLIRRTCYTDYNILFDKDINYEEDKLVCLKILSHDVIVSYLDKAFYHYDHTQNKHSLSNTSNPAKRLLILERISDYCDISTVQAYYDQAILYIAYQALCYRQVKKFSSLFKKHLDSIIRAKGFPFHVKLFVILGIHNIFIPVGSFKRLVKSYDS